MKHVGIDYGSKLAGTTVIAFPNDAGQIELLQSAKKQDADLMLIQWLQMKQPASVFLDAPLSLPSVYRNPNDAADYFYRLADKELKAMSPMFLGGLTARAMRLSSQLKTIGLNVYEVYPGALAKELGFSKEIYKKNKENIEKLSLFLQERFKLELANKIENWHQFDALLAYCTGLRFERNEHLSFGQEEEGLIFI